MSQKVEVEISARLDQLERQLASVGGMVQRTTSQISSSFGGLSSGLTGVAAGLVSAFSVDAFAGIVTGAIDAQDKLVDLSKATSLSVETLAGLGVAARKSGSNLDDIAASINKLSVNMGKEPEKFRQIGVTAKDPIEAFKQLADVFKAIEDPQERAAFGAAALSKTWAGAAPLLMEGGKAIGDMVESGTRLSKVTAESAKAADELNDRLEDLKTASMGTRTALANALVPSMIETLKIMDQMRETGSVLGPLLGSIGRQRISFDANFASTETQIKDLATELSSLESKREKLMASGGGLLNQWLYGKKDDLDQKILVTRNQLEALKKYGDKLTGAKGEETPAIAAKAPDVRKFIDGDAVAKATQISDGERLIQQLKDRLATTQNLNEVEQLESRIADDRYRKITAGEKDIALALAAQIDARKQLSAELDKELDAIRKKNREFDAQDSRLKSLVGSTDIGKAQQTMLDEALAESALRTGKIDTSTYDQIIAKLREVKDEGRDTFKDLEDAINGWGKSAASAIVDFAMTGKASFSDMANSIIQDMMRMVVQENVTGPMAKAVSGWFKGLDLFGSANGNVFPASTGLHEYVNTVQTSPKVFGFANGGVFAEAGPEAVMPLSRDTNGRLGVKAQGASAAANVQVNIIESAGSKKNGTVSSRDEGGKTIIDVFVEQVKGALIADVGGGGSFASAMEGQYGLNRAAGAWR